MGGNNVEGYPGLSALGARALGNEEQGGGDLERNYDVRSARTRVDKFYQIVVVPNAGGN